MVNCKRHVAAIFPGLCSCPCSLPSSVLSSAFQFFELQVRRNMFDGSGACSSERVGHTIGTELWFYSPPAGSCTPVFGTW